MSADTAIKEVNWPDVLSSPYYGMVFLGLANAAYTSEGDASSIYSDLHAVFDSDKYLPKLPDVGQAGVEDPRTIPGNWSLDWGPAVADDNSNMLYIASYRGSDNAPLLYAVCIRGTDTSSGVEGLIDQIKQDLDDFSLESWQKVLADNSALNLKAKPVDSQTGKVSIGSKDGFVKLAGLKAKLTQQGDGVILATALQSLLEEQAAPVVVTGHSLGGNQTQVIAAYLDWQFGDVTEVIPQSFAPPTPGDAAFATQPVFKRGQFWFNTLDLVPYAYITMDDGDKQVLGISWAKDHLWHAYTWPEPMSGQGPRLPELLRLAIDGLGRFVPHTFSRPVEGGMIQLNGSLPDLETLEQFMKSADLKPPIYSAEGSLVQLMWQHLPPCYRSLMWSQQKDKLVNFDFKSYPSGS